MRIEELLCIAVGSMMYSVYIVRDLDINIYTISVSCIDLEVNWTGTAWRSVAY